MKRIKLEINPVVRRQVDTINTFYNGLSVPAKKTCVLFFGLMIGSTSMLLIIQSVYHNKNSNSKANQSITVPKDTYMKKLESISENMLNPIGKLKGEINGEFEAFYLAMDDSGQLYINRSLSMTKDAYDKANGWEKISREELKEYEKQLHFLPHRSKGLHR